MRCSVYAPEFAEHAPPVQPPPRASSSSNHVIKYRIAIPFLGKRYYLAFFVGRCQRAQERVVAEGQRRSWAHVTFSMASAFMLVSTMLVCGAAAVYLGKSMMGIDLFEEHSFMHHLFLE